MSDHHGMRAEVIMILSAVLWAAPPATAFAQAADPQAPRAPRKDAKGLLRIDETSYDLAAKTGGDFYFWAQGEFASSNVVIPMHGAEISLAYGSLGSLQRRFEIPVDEGIGTLVVFAGMQRKDLAVLLDPEGSAVRDPASVRQSQHMLIAEVPSPKRGVWTLEVSGAGKFSFSASGRRGRQGAPMIESIDAEFVERGGRPGHEGLFPIAGNPRAGSTAILRVRVDEQLSRPILDFWRIDGTVLRKGIKPASRDGDELLFELEVPAEAFRIVIRGLDSKGTEVQRIDNRLFEPKGTGR